MVQFDLKEGLSGTARVMVTSDNTAIAYGSGRVGVFATPAMVGLMEKAAIEAVDSRLGREYVSVGTRIDVKHFAPTPVGMSITADAELLEVDGPRLKFRVEAYDGKEKIGEGMHYRYVIKLDDLNSRAEGKLK
ncbi:MAG: thioesterase family protein [Actinomycetota bacterium]